MKLEPLDATAALALAQQQGQSWVDAAVAARIAAGAAATVTAVQASLAAVTCDGLLASDPEAFLSVLEALVAEEGA